MTEEYEARVQALETLHNRLHFCSPEQKSSMDKLQVMEIQGEKLVNILKKPKHQLTQEDKLFLAAEQEKDKVLVEQFRAVENHNQVWKLDWSDVCKTYVNLWGIAASSLRIVIVQFKKPKDEKSYPTMNLGKGMRPTTHALSLRFHHVENAMATKGNDIHEGSHCCHDPPLFSHYTCSG
jgi:hypothetical protein